MNYEHQLYKSPLDIPERRIGRMEIKHRIFKKGEEVAVIGGRQAVVRGLPFICTKLTKPLRVHCLIEHRKVGGTSLWMTDNPEELNQIGEMLHTVQPQGRVLVGGLGLGILASTVAQLPDVAEVVVVERSADVIKLCGNTALFRTVRSDIGKYLRESDEQFDFYLLDTWAGTSEGDWWDTVMPLRRIIRNRWGFKPTIHCWAEDQMWQQVGHRLETCKTPHWYYSEHLNLPWSADDVEAFLNTVGTNWWEKKYGAAVDRTIKEVAGG